MLLWDDLHITNVSRTDCLTLLCVYPGGEFGLVSVFLLPSILRCVGWQQCFHIGILLHTFVWFSVHVSYSLNPGKHGDYLSFICCVCFLPCGWGLLLYSLTPHCYWCHFSPICDFLFPLVNFIYKTIISCFVTGACFHYSSLQHKFPFIH